MSRLSPLRLHGLLRLGRSGGYPARLLTGACVPRAELLRGRRGLPFRLPDCHSHRVSARAVIVFSQLLVFLRTPPLGFRFTSGAFAF